jgi:hypothetical protein
MLKAVLIGTLNAVVLNYGSVALHEHSAVNGSESMWLIAISSPIQALASLLPGFNAGWVARERGVLAGFLAGLFGNVVYTALFGTFWNSILADGMAGAVSMILWLFLMAVSWGLYGAAAGGTARLLRSHKLLQGDARNARG